jgi:hypothetical protein
MNPKSEDQNPRSEGNPKTEARTSKLQWLALGRAFHQAFEVASGLRISGFFRVSRIRNSAFRMNRPLSVLSGFTALAWLAAAQPLPEGITESPSTATQRNTRWLQPPTQVFRELLALAPADRERALAEKVPAYRDYLRGKLAEFETLNADEREVRLRALSLRWHLLVLIRTPAGARAERLAGLREEDRRLVEERIAAWDKLPVEAQRELMENQYTVDYLLQFSSGIGRRETILESVSPEQRARIEADLARFNELPPEQRQRIHENFERFFELNGAEKQRVLAAVPGAARVEMQKTITALDALPEDQRRRCLDALQRFTQMNAAERDQFLANAERWQRMSADERQSWRQLVRQWPPEPPLPPGFVPR